MTADLRREEITRIAQLLHDNGVACEMHGAPRSFANAHEVHAERLYDAGLRDTVRIAAVLRLHYVTAIECDHDTKMDTIRCNCSVWTGTPQPSVGAAVRQWVDHVLAASPSPDTDAGLDVRLLREAFEALESMPLAAMGHAVEVRRKLRERLASDGPDRRCIFTPCVATWEHYHGGFPGGYDNPDDPTGPPIRFTGPDPDPTAVRDYNGAALTNPGSSR